MALPELPDRISEESLSTVRNSISALTQERDHFQQFIDQMLDGLEEMRQEIDQRESELFESRTALANKKIEMDQALEKIHGQQEINERRRRELEEISRELAQCHEQIATLEEERDSSRARMDEAVAELDSVAGVLDLMETTQDELNRTREELLEARAALREQAEGSPSEELDELKRVKQELEKELRASRLNAEQLAEKVASQNRQLAEYRDKMTKDLSGLRHAVQKRAESLRVKPSPAPSESSTADLAPASPPQTNRSKTSRAAHPAAATESTAEEATSLPADSASDESSWPSTRAEEDWPSQEEEAWGAEEEQEWSTSHAEWDQAVGDNSPDEELTAEAAATDPVVGSVLAKFAKIEKTADEVDQ